MWKPFRLGVTAVYLCMNTVVPFFTLSTKDGKISQACVNQTGMFNTRVCFKEPPWDHV